MTLNLLIQEIPWNKKMEVLRVVKGWKQQIAAEMCGTNQKGYWLWETGKSYPHFNNRKAIASAFDVSVEEIFGEGLK
jgi:DNA-binding XRE family transcriptional regulator